MAEYLKFQPPELDKFDAQDLAWDGKILTPWYLSQLLYGALDLINTTPGPNVNRRQRYSYDWLGKLIEWVAAISYQSKNKILTKNKNITTLEKLGQEFLKLKDTGVVLGATFDMTPGQREFLSESRKIAKNVAVGLERHTYFLRHPLRREPFFPVSIRMSLLALMGYRPFLIPDMPSWDTESHHYKQVFEGTGAKKYIFTRGDPWAEEKMRRGDATALPELDSRHGSDFTKKLMPDAELTFSHLQKQSLATNAEMICLGMMGDSSVYTEK